MNGTSLDIITHGYPSRRDPAEFPFVRIFAHAVARASVGVTVIAPVPWHVAIQGGLPLREVETVRGGHEIIVLRPRFVSVSNRALGAWNTFWLGQASFEAAVRRTFSHWGKPLPTAFYGHFLFRGGAAAARLGSEFGRPAFPMVGEGRLESVQNASPERLCNTFKGVTAFMANSTELAEAVTAIPGLLEGRPIGVFPNGIDMSTFFPRNRQETRKMLGLPQEGFLVICVAKQDMEKGPARVGEALRGLDGVSGLFLGSGPNPPVAENVLLNRPVPHDEVAKWLSAADVFVLPSTWEGSCNAILEAMACGIPVIASKGRFNDDILNDKVSIRVDPFDVEAIRRAIVRLRDDRLLKKEMAASALNWSKQFDVRARAQAIVQFIRTFGRLGTGSVNR